MASGRRLRSARASRMQRSSCARAITVEEARFRVDYPNSVPRRIKIIALDGPAERAVRRLAQKDWNSATFITTTGEVNLPDQIAAADLVVTVSTAGENSDDAAIVADACSLHRVM